MPIKDHSNTPARVRQAAEAVAVSALGFLAQEPDRIGRFLAETGLGPAELRAAAREPHFNAGLLAFLLADEPLLIEFASHAGLKPQDVARAHDVLNPPFDPDAPARRER